MAKILALYDIHGNIDALRAVLSDPRASRPDIVVVGGDTVPGPWAREVFERLEAIEAPVTWVRGNGEREVAEAAQAAEVAGRPAAADTAASTAALSAAEIGAERARRLGGLPLTIEVEGVLFCHASPRRDDEVLTRFSPPERWAEALSGVSARVVVGGHTHQQDDRRVGVTRFVNAGSVGMPYEGDGAARWLWIEDGVPELRSTPYDARGAGERMLAAGWPDRDSVGAALIEPIDADEITRYFEAGPH